jgi:hypothetical protein
MKTIAGLICAFLAFFGASPLHAQTCNSPSGWMEMKGPFTPGNVPILTTDCLHFVDGGPITGAGNISSKNASYTVADVDDHTTIFLTQNGTVHNQTITIPVLSSLTDNRYSVQICNRSSHRWNISSVDSGVLTGGLWPNQCNSLISNGTILSYQFPPARFVNPNGIYYMGLSPNCDDTSDGLTNDTINRMCTGQTVVDMIQHYTDGQFTNPKIKLAQGGTYSGQFSVVGYGPCCADGIVIEGDTAIPTNTLVQSTVGAPAFFARDYGIIFVQFLEITCTAASSGGINSSQFSTIDIKSVVFGSCTGNVMAEAQDGGHVDFNTGVTIAGNGSLFCFALGAGSQCGMGNQVFTCSGAPGFTTFVESNHNAEIIGNGATFSGCGTVTGQRYFAGFNSTVGTGSSGNANFFPGNVAGASVNITGQYD